MGIFKKKSVRIVKVRPTHSQIVRTLKYYYLLYSSVNNLITASFDPAECNIIQLNKL